MRSPTGRPELELWGGVECTVNRVGDRWFSQLDRMPGLLCREHLHRLADLGITTLRFPVLWERVMPDGETPDWSWSDERLEIVRELGITPIVGLVHHGSGPRHTSLVDPAFPDKLAAYAAQVAARYPWVRHYTPINEPLTTARFSGLYGFWYPHARDEPTFRTALLNQCRATVLAMRAIEQVVPDAQLVQTDDLGKTWSTPLLAYQATFNNHLRWLAWDLLCGRVDPAHPLWWWLTVRCRASEDELHWHTEHRRPPDLIGINYYITSERFIDERLERYPPHLHGGNGRHRYADIEAVRVLDPPSPGLQPLLEETWARYGIPLAVTEAHIDATREDQMRWVAEIWQAAQRARATGADVRAVTAWGLLGVYDWNCLVTQDCGYYESGAFDMRGGTLRPTAVAALLRQLARGEPEPAHPALAGNGWWRRPGRLLGTSAREGRTEQSAVRRPGPPILITGGRGTLGQAFARVCAERDLHCVLLERSELDIADPEAIERVLDRYQPWAIINAAGYVRVDDAERDEERCFRENTFGPERLAVACARHRCRLLTFSSDLVFDGRKRAPYVESDSPAPLNVYGRSKADAERRVLDRYPEALVVRTSAFFGPWDVHNFVHKALQALSSGALLEAASDVTVSPTYVPDLVNVCLNLLIDGEGGLCHLTNGEPVTWAELARRAARRARVDASRLVQRPGRALRMPARRPPYSALANTRTYSMPPLDDALGRYTQLTAAQWTLPREASG
ncbi:MAG TPA: family 1 glycosylhydrolase [Lysobacter sp.]|nr:family 1 glycosylhydrolase [Lysobacter sp.]